MTIDVKNNTRERVGAKVYIQRRGKANIYTASFWHNGKSIKQSLKTSNKEVARKRAGKIDHDLVSGEFAEVKRQVTVSEAIEEYLEVKRGEGRAYKTMLKYTQWLQAFEAFCKQKNIRTLQQVTARTFESFRGHQRSGLSEKSLYTGLTIIKQLMKWVAGGGRDYLARNPVAFCRMQQPYIKPKFTPTLSQVNAILSAAKGERKLQFALMAYTGLRVQEMQMLRPRDVDLREGWIHVAAREGWTPKTRQARKVPIHPALLALLKDKGGDPKRTYYFINPHSQGAAIGHQPIYVREVNVDLQRLAARCGIRTGRRDDGIVVHSLRHFFETQCVDAGTPQFVVDAWMGHAGHAQMGRHYYGLTDEKSKQFMTKVQF